MSSGLKKTVSVLMTVSTLVCIIPCQVFAASKGWVEVSTGKDGLPEYRYYTTSTKYAKGWKKIEGCWYYFDKDDGIMVRKHKGDTKIYKKVEGKKYCFDTKGKMQTGWKKSGSNYTFFTSKGPMIKKGLQKANGKYYYFVSENGVNVRIDGHNYKKYGGMQGIGWSSSFIGFFSSKYYTYKGHIYDIEKGKAAKGWIENEPLLATSGTFDFYCSAKGELTTGWKKIKGKWYYFYPRDTGDYYKYQMIYDCTLKIGGKKYKFNSKGVCTNP